MARIWPQPLIVVDDVPASSRFYTELLGAESGHGGDEYEQVLSHGEIVLQLHDYAADDNHGPLASVGDAVGNGIVLWFEVEDFDAAVQRVRAMGAHVERDVQVNAYAKQQEIWLGDPDGYRVVLAGPSEWRPRPS